MRKEEIIIQEGKNPLKSLWKHLQSLKSTVSFMQTGAHPDDETSKLLSKLSLGMGMHVTYINAVRGQGGQNALGIERGAELGAIRTKELINAMGLLRVDLGWLAEEKNDAIHDFGFSKSGDQTFDIWGKDHTLRQMVKMVRLFKPDIIIPTFLDVNGQHGHHRAITRTTIKAFEISNNCDYFSDLNLDPWEITNLFLPAWGGGGSSYYGGTPYPENCGLGSDGASGIICFEWTTSGSSTSSGSSTLYSFSSHEFTNCGKDGKEGPSLTECRTFYQNQGVTWDVDTNLNMTTNGIQEWTVPTTGSYKICAYGAQGGDDPTNPAPGGKGAKICGNFNLTQGEIIKIAVGQKGGNENDATYGSYNPRDIAAGGGGGTFVVRSLGNSPLVVAGGGGGGSDPEWSGGPGGDGRTDQGTGEGGGLGGGGGACGASAGGAGDADADRPPQDTRQI